MLCCFHRHLHIFTSPSISPPLLCSGLKSAAEELVKRKEMEKLTANMTIGEKSVHSAAATINHPGCPSIGAHSTLSAPSHCAGTALKRSSQHRPSEEKRLVRAGELTTHLAQFCRIANQHNLLFSCFSCSAKPCARNAERLV